MYPSKCHMVYINAYTLAGGLFTGAEVRKTEEQQKVYGGLANAALDPCYHQV